MKVVFVYANLFGTNMLPPAIGILVQVAQECQILGEEEEKVK